MSDPWVTMIPLISGLSKCFLQIFAISCQSFGSMSSESFMNGVSIIGLQIFFSSGAMFSIASESVGIAPPVLGSSLELIVPPVIMIATFGRFGFSGICLDVFSGSFDSSRILADRISDSLIPML